MTESRSPDHWPDMEAVKAIERVVWHHGIQGDGCAVVAASILDALAAAGYAVLRTTGEHALG